VTRIDPGMPDAIIEYGDKIHVRADGQPVVDNHWIVSEENWGEMVAGYRCCECGHVQSEPFPEQCEFQGSALGMTWRCPNRMRDDQLRKLGAEFKRRADFTPPDPYEVLDIERDDWKPTRAGILVPGDE